MQQIVGTCGRRLVGVRLSTRYARHGLHIGASRGKGVWFCPALRRHRAEWTSHWRNGCYGTARRTFGLFAGRFIRHAQEFAAFGTTKFNGHNACSMERPRAEIRKLRGPGYQGGRASVNLRAGEWSEDYNIANVAEVVRLWGVSSELRTKFSRIRLPCPIPTIELARPSFSGTKRPRRLR
jgi:hypothetical protein